MIVRLEKARIILLIFGLVLLIIFMPSVADATGGVTFENQGFYRITADGAGQRTEEAINRIVPGLILAKASVTNQGTQQCCVTVVMGLYTESGLRDMACDSGMIPASGLCEFKPELNIPKDNNYYTIKIFVLDGFDRVYPLGNLSSFTSTYYERPAADSIITNLKQNYPQNAHPRVMATAETFAVAKEHIASDGFAGLMYYSVKAAADGILNKPPAVYGLKENDLRFSDECSQVKPRVTTLAGMYRLSGDPVYANRAWQELLAAAGFPDWNPKHFLDAAGMTEAFAIGYDWLYDYLSEEQKEIVRTALVEKGLNQGLQSYRDPTYGGSLRSGWVKATNNWNVYCNSGMALGALAVGDEYEALSGEILESGLESLEYMLPEFAPDGGWVEGPSYWDMTVAAMVHYMAALDSALGTDYGYLSGMGVAKTSYFPIYMTGTVGAFNFSDANMLKVIDTPEQLWLAMKSGDANLPAIRRSYINAGTAKADILDLLWYNPDNCNETVTQLPPDGYFRHVETATLRSGWESAALFAGLHAGDNAANHSHLDMGSFVIDVFGKRWAEDLGSDRLSYTTYGGDKRWQLYRLRAEGHNTLVIKGDEEAPPENETGLIQLVDDSFNNLPKGSKPGSYWDTRLDGTGVASVEDVPSTADKSLLLSNNDTTGGQAFIQRTFNPYLTGQTVIEYKIRRMDKISKHILAKCKGQQRFGYRACPL